MKKGQSRGLRTGDTICLEREEQQIWQHGIQEDLEALH